MSRKLKSGEPQHSTPSERGQAKSPVRAQAAKRQDALLIHGISADGESMAVLRAREDRVEAGIVRALKEGEPMGDGEVLKLTPRPEFPLLCDVEVQVPQGTINASGSSEAARQQLAASSRGRPAQVATDTYRENWDAIWRKPGKKPLAN